MFYVAELWQGGSRAENIALLRAAWKLEANGKIAIQAYAFGSKRILVTRPGYVVDRISFDRMMYAQAYPKC